MTTFVVCVFLSVDRFVVCVFLSVDRFDDTLKKCRVYVELMKRFPETVAKVGVSNDNITPIIITIYIRHTHRQTHTRVAYKQRCRKALTAHSITRSLSFQIGALDLLSKKFYDSPPSPSLVQPAHELLGRWQA